MRIQKISLSWFRGASESVTLDTEGKSLVIYGDNASGKSSFADAFELIIRKGKIEHLSHEYAKSDHDFKTCIRNVKSPPDVEAKATIEFDSGEKVTASIPQTGGIRYESAPPDFITDIQSWESAHHLLRQDEIADFIKKTKSEKYSALSPLLGLSHFEQVAENIESLKASFENESGFTRLIGVEETLMAEFLPHFADLNKKTVQSTVEKIAQKYGAKIKPSFVDTANEGITNIQSEERNIEPEIKRMATIDQIRVIKILDDIDAYIKLFRDTEAVKDNILNYQIDILEKTKNFLDIQDQDTVVCPACGSEVRADAFEAHVTNELTKLGEYRNYKKSIEVLKENIRRKYEQIQSLSLGNPHFLIWFEQEFTKSPQSLFTEYELDQFLTVGERWDVSSVTKARELLERIFIALDREAASGKVTIPDLYSDKAILESALKIPEYYKILERIQKIRVISGDLEKIHSTIRKKIAEKTKTELEKISSNIREIWGKLHPDEPIDNITLAQPSANDCAIDISLKFHGVDMLSPRLTLSEGYRNSLGLSVFLAFANQGDSVDHPIILDDIVSSLDSNHMGFVAELLNSNFSDRQIILLTHDRNWYIRLLSQLDRSKWNFAETLPWDKPETGIRITHMNHTFQEAIELLKSNPRAAGGAVRATMDVTLPQNVMNLRLEMPYLFGPKNEMRMNHDFFMKLISEGKRKLKKKNAVGVWEPYSAVITSWETADRLLVAWANPPVHGGRIAPAEVKHLIDCCETALNYFECPDCKTKIWQVQDGEKKLCRCGNIKWG